MDLKLSAGESVFDLVDRRPSQRVEEVCRRRLSERAVWQLLCREIWFRARRSCWQARQETSWGLYSRVLWVAAQQFQSRMLGVKR